MNTTFIFKLVNGFFGNYQRHVPVNSLHHIFDTFLTVKKK